MSYVAIKRSIAEIPIAASKKVEFAISHLCKNGITEFYTPQASNENMLVQVVLEAINDLFVHLPYDLVMARRAIANLELPLTA